MSREQLCLALDVDNQFIAKKLVQELSDYVGIFKIGFQLFVAEGPQIISAIRNSGSEIFLDLKFHDIPNTVAEVSRVVTGLGVSMFNIHAVGGIDMMTAAVKAASSEAKHIGIEKPKVLAVTLLTSLDEYALQDQLRVKDTVQDYVVHLALLAKKSGIDGVIASPQEIGLIRSTCGPNFIIGTPGIRMPDSSPDDQKRTLAPKQAIDAGATFIIVGRPIRNAKDPVMAAKEILNELE